MKTTEIILQAEKSNSGETQKKSKTGKALKYLLFLFMLSWICFLPSCAVAVRTPEPTITIESQHHGFWHRSYHHHNEYRDQDDHHR